MNMLSETPVTILNKHLGSLKKLLQQIETGDGLRIPADRVEEIAPKLEIMKQECEKVIKYFETAISLFSYFNTYNAQKMPIFPQSAAIAADEIQPGLNDQSAIHK